MFMAEFDDTIYDDLNLDEFSDPIEKQEPITTEDDIFSSHQLISESNTNSVLDHLLKDKGIIDGKIKIIDEDNKETEINFSDLTIEEQLQILKDDVDSKYELDDSEISLINRIREEKTTVDGFLEKYKQEIIDSVKETTSQNYEIDAYDDSELFLLDLKNKYNLTEEELAKELEKELKDETLFKKKVDILRAEYKQLEDQEKENRRIEFEEKQKQEFEEFAQQMVDIAIATPEFYGIELEDDEKNEVLSFLLDIDEHGDSEFHKALTDPKKLYEAAWFLRYGKESFDALKNAYESEISKLKDSAPKIVRISGQKNNKESIYDLI